MKTQTAETLKKHREKKGLSQKDVSEKLGYTTPQFISNWERGVSKPPKKDIRKISGIIGCEPKELALAMLNDNYKEEQKYYKKFF